MRRIFACLALLVALPLLAQQQMEIIALRHRTVEEVLPVLRPLVEPGGTLSGMSGQLIVRASPRNLEALREALAAIDRPARRLVIHVSQDRVSERRREAVGVSGSVAAGEHVRLTESGRPGTVGTRIEIRQGDSVVRVQGDSAQSSRQERALQSVQVVDGGRAHIHVGRSLPLPMRQIVPVPGGAVVSDSIVYRDVGQGFVAVPRLNGDRVSLEIRSAFDEPSHAGYGSVSSQQLSTTVSGRLGEWIELGGKCPAER